MTVMVCLTRCWDCMTFQCPGGPHGWAGADDIAHAKATGQPDPSGQSCGCRCVDGPALDLDPFEDMVCRDCGRMVDGIEDPQCLCVCAAGHPTPGGMECERCLWDDPDVLLCDDCGLPWSDHSLPGAEWCPDLSETVVETWR